MQLIKKSFGSHQDRDIDLYTVSNDNGLVVSLTNFGGTITSIRFPDRRGKPDHVILGYDTLADYRDDTNFLGAVIGRCADRIGYACFQIDGTVYRVSANAGIHHLHGGFQGFSKKIWDATPVREKRGCGLSMTLNSPDGDEGFPGTVDVRVLFLLTPDNELFVEYTAASDHATVVNLTQQLLFNLGGDRTIANHVLQINASGFTPTTAELIPVGTLKQVNRSILDFRAPRVLTQVLADAGPGDLIDGGFDHHLVLDGGGSMKKPASVLYHRDSGRVVTISTTQPGLHLYTCNGQGAGSKEGADRLPGEWAAVCLRPQHFPDSPNQRAFPSVILPAGRLYHQRTCYRFERRV